MDPKTFKVANMKQIFLDVDSVAVVAVGVAFALAVI